MFSGGWRKSVSPAQPSAPPIVPGDDPAGTAAAADELFDLLCAAYTDPENCIHAETIIGGAAALTGEFALRAAGIPLPRIGFVFGPPINEVLFEGRDGRTPLWQLLETSAAEIGLARDDMPDVHAIFGRIAATAAALTRDPACGEVFPPLSVPDGHFPREWSPNAGPRLRQHVRDIAARHALTPHQIACALCIATGRLIARGRDVLDPRIAYQLATEIMFSTAKMAPLEARM
jgi:hypothetical protein